ncbi:expressed unknown protein [Seminavis robusta]|uniref:Ionotropic glutamate receptor C-terminal domain-containing protein n=1 Tax=Seminavis robusta TaxID=568900 RepID=A0A9N8HXR6_9STRA|nr:expressed unknown protein [Seminavis robusta]|eukprot:Sro2288_g322060.1 n/a (398) ;mRNA; r:1780-2973
MTIWALVITTTYTANLASLFVEARVELVIVDSLEKAVVYGYPVCTLAYSSSDNFLKKTVPKLHRVQRVDDRSSFESLTKGECALALTYVDKWLSAKLNPEYNPSCNLEWVGDRVKNIKSGFAVKADSGDKCSSLVRDVVNLHFIELIEKGVLAEAWRKRREMENNGDHCGYVDDAHQDSNRQLQFHSNQPELTSNGRNVSPGRRMLSVKGGAKAPGGATDGATVSSATLTVQQMLGTFIMHWGAMLVAIVVSCISAYIQKLNCCQKKEQVVEKVVYRKNGPIIGIPPRLNTVVVHNLEDSALYIGHNPSELGSSPTNDRRQENAHLANEGSSENKDESGVYSMHESESSPQNNGFHAPTWQAGLAALDAKMDMLLQTMQEGGGQEEGVWVGKYTVQS